MAQYNDIICYFKTLFQYVRHAMYEPVQVLPPYPVVHEHMYSLGFEALILQVALLAHGLFSQAFKSADKHNMYNVNSSET